MDTIILPCEVQGLCCRFPKYSLVTSAGELEMLFSATLSLFLFFFIFLFSLCCEDASAAGISNPFFPCLFSLCCAYTSLPSQPGLSSQQGIQSQKEAFEWLL